MLFDPRDRVLSSGPARRPPPLPELPPDSAVGEMVTRFSVEWERTRAVERSNSSEIMLGEAVQPFLDAYEAETGQALQNPYDFPDGEEELDLGGARFPQLQLRSRDQVLLDVSQRYERARSAPGDRMVSRLPRWPGEEELRRRAIARAQDAEERAERAAALSSSSAGTAGMVAGAIGSTMRDPINLASMLLGAPGAAGILRTMAIEAGVGAGAEALLQPQVVAWKRELGQEPGFAEIAGNVALAGIGAGIFAGLIKGSWHVVRPLLTRDQRAAVHVGDALDTRRR